ncbi:phytanoyl-CoA dioxygenase [Gordoniibacillus kamchatkensis]|uniref:Phytanoyl-CoA dioxygenase n=2 Tax=Gordoniibacillus kamchatkensis TaxID=1590651 RepID=A0ABR5A4X2_9BACL|nr:phytanoyl-CoA dioxygenase family protein [Paenibacillus sp. VKM B-2647]KIL36091.1 phytanoyl-CoA dioxygenase [Paenibacillus sp. VKM B-2647]
MDTQYRLTPEQKQQFEQDGFVIVKGLFGADEIERLKANFMEMHAGGPIAGCFEPVPVEQAGGDILKAYPRMMHPHRVNRMAFEYMLDARVMSVLAELFGEEPLAAQSMFYFKPPGARGQALHQDNFYLKIEPGTCIAAWTAVDPADEENGGMFVARGSHREPIYCPQQADPAVSFTKDYVELPAGMELVQARMEAGDVLFFNGSVIHGSQPNTSRDRFRRSFICHYAGVSTTRAGRFYSPMYRADGTAVTIEDNPDGGPCGAEHEKQHGPH